MTTTNLSVLASPPSQPAKAKLPTQKPDPAKIAVLLNRNARRVTDRIMRRIERIVGSENVYYSRNLDEAEAFCREIVQKGYGTVACGGGDGTLSGAINMIRTYVDESNDWRRERHERLGEAQTLLEMPRFAFLRLGTGNAMANVVGAQNALDDIRRLVDYVPSRNFQLPMLRAGDTLSFFAGAGYDSVLLNDYNWMKQNTKHPITRGLMHSVVGYLVAAVTRTVPSALAGKLDLEAKITTKGPAYYVDPRRGDAIVKLDISRTLFEGSTKMIAAGTHPYFGSGFRAFPFSNMMPGMMNLRVASIGPLSVLGNLPSLWKGHYRNSERVLDFLVNEVEVELQAPFPFQHSGEAMGEVERFTLRIDDQPIELVDFLSPHSLRG